MQFLNDVTLDDIVNNNVDVVMLTTGGMVELAQLCEVFLGDDVPFIDFIPKLNRQFVAPIPDDAIISINEAELSSGRYGVFIPRDSEAGKLFAAILRSQRESRG